VASFYVDHDVSQHTARELRDAGHSVVTVRDLGLTPAGDDGHLLRAAQNGRILITHNASDFQLLHDAGRRWARVGGSATARGNCRPASIVEPTGSSTPNRGPPQ